MAFFLACPKCGMNNKFDVFNTGECKGCRHHYGKCRVCGKTFNSGGGVSETCSDCRMQKAAKGLAKSLEGTARGKAIQSIQSANTNIFTVGPKVLAGLSNWSAKMEERKTPEDYEREALAKLKEARERHVNSARAELAYKFRKERFESLDQAEKDRLNKLQCMEDNESSCKVCGGLISVALFFVLLIESPVPWWACFLLFWIPFAICYAFRKNKGLGYVSTAINWALGVSIPLSLLLVLVDWFVDVPGWAFIFCPIIGAILGVLMKKSPPADIGVNKVQLTEDEIAAVDEAGEKAGFEFDEDLG